MSLAPPLQDMKEQPASLEITVRNVISVELVVDTTVAVQEKVQKQLMQVLLTANVNCQSDPQYRETLMRQLMRSLKNCPIPSAKKRDLLMRLWPAVAPFYVPAEKVSTWSSWVDVQLQQGVDFISDQVRFAPEEFKRVAATYLGHKILELACICCCPQSCQLQPPRI